MGSKFKYSYRKYNFRKFFPLFLLVFSLVSAFSHTRVSIAVEFAILVEKEISEEPSPQSLIAEKTDCNNEIMNVALHREKCSEHFVISVFLLLSI